MEEGEEGLQEPEGFKDTTRKPTESTNVDLERLIKTVLSTREQLLDGPKPSAHI